MISTTTLGSAMELLAAVKLMSEGYSVFRSLSQTAPFDLVIEKDGKMARVEVKKAQRMTRKGTLLAPNSDKNLYDILALVHLDGAFTHFDFRPSLESFFGDSLETA